MTTMKSTAIATFVYAYAGARIKPVLSAVTTYYVSTHFERTGNTSAAGAPRRSAARRADGLSSTGIHARRQW